MRYDFGKRSNAATGKAAGTTYTQLPSQAAVTTTQSTAAKGVDEVMSTPARQS